MEIEFRIEFIFEDITRNSPHLTAKLLTEGVTIKLTKKTELGGFGIKKLGMPRVLDDEGQPRFDLYTFNLKDKSELTNFKKGAIVKFVE